MIRCKNAVWVSNDTRNFSAVSFVSKAKYDDEIDLYLDKNSEEESGRAPERP